MLRHVRFLRIVQRAAMAMALSSALACSASPTKQGSSPTAANAPIARVWRARCGACHVPVEPGTRTREHLEDALARHRGRARLSEQQWAELVSFLAAPQGVATLSR
jgi:hypothetical protein